MKKYGIIILAVLVSVSVLGLSSVYSSIDSAALNSLDIRDSAATSDGGVIYTGMAYSPDTHDDILLIKTGSDGNIVFKKTFHRATEDEDPPVVSDEHGSYVFETYDDGYLVIGMSSVFQDGDVPYAMKTDSNGNMQWGRSIIGSEELIKDISVTPDRGFLVLGYNYIAQSYILLKYDKEFNLEWKNPL